MNGERCATFNRFLGKSGSDNSGISAFYWTRITTQLRGKWEAWFR